MTTTAVGRSLATLADGELIARHRAGDRDAFEVLYRRYQPRLVAFCSERTPDRFRAEDLAHETLIRALIYLHSYDTSRPLWPWLRTIAARVVVNSRPRVATNLWSSNDLAVEDRPPPELVHDDQMHNVELRLVVDRAVRKLPPRQRVALRLLYANDWTAAEAGRRMGLKRPAFQQLVLRARRNLRTHLASLRDARLGLALPALVGVRLRAARDRIRARVGVEQAAGAFPVIGEVGIQAVGAVAMAVALTVGGMPRGDTSLATQASRPQEVATTPTVASTPASSPSSFESRSLPPTTDLTAADAPSEQEEVNPAPVATVRAPLDKTVDRDDTAESTISDDDDVIIVERYVLTNAPQHDAPDPPDHVEWESETKLYCDGPGAATACEVLRTGAEIRDDVAG